MNSSRLLYAIYQTLRNNTEFPNKIEFEKALRLKAQHNVYPHHHGKPVFNLIDLSYKPETCVIVNKDERNVAIVDLYEEENQLTPDFRTGEFLKYKGRDLKYYLERPVRIREYPQIGGNRLIINSRWQFPGNNNLKQKVLNHFEKDSTILWADFDKQFFGYNHGIIPYFVLKTKNSLNKIAELPYRPISQMINLVEDSIRRTKGSQMSYP